MTYWLHGYMFTLHFYLLSSHQIINPFVVLSAQSLEKFSWRLWIFLLVDLMVVKMLKWVSFSSVNLDLTCSVGSIFIVGIHTQCSLFFKMFCPFPLGWELFTNIFFVLLFNFKSLQSLCGSKTCHISSISFGRHSHNWDNVCNNWIGLYIKHLSWFENCTFHQKEES